MFHWICPECGREIPPSVRECPACDPHSQSRLTEQVAAAAAPVETQPPALPAPPAPVETQPPALPAPPAPVEAQPPAVPPSARAVSVIAVLPAGAPPSALLPADAAPAETVPAISTPVNATGPVQRSLRAGLERLSAPPAAAAVWSAPEPVHTPPSLVTASRSVALLAQSEPQPAAFGFLKWNPAADALRHALSTSLASPPGAVSSEAPAHIETAPSFAAAKPNLQDASAWTGPAPPAAGLQDYTIPAFRKIVPVTVPVRILKPDSGPRMTLPGPALPPQLHSLQGAGISYILTGRAAAGNAAARVRWGSMLAITALLSAGVSGVFYALPHILAGPKKAPPREVQAATAPVPSSYMLSRAVEVTGFRFADDSAKKTAVHYLVVNHSSAGLGDVTIYVTLWASGTRPGQPPLCRFSFRAAGLGPLEAKEMSTSIDKLSRVGTLPEWQDLRAQVELSQ